MRARDFRNNAWACLTGKWGVMILTVLIFELIMGACSGLSLLGVGSIALLLITGPLTLGLSQQFLCLVRGQRVEVAKMFDGFKNFANAFLLSIINSILIALWSLLLVIPGIIKAYSYSMSYYILADNPAMSANTARVQSMELMNGNKWRLFCLDCSFIGWYILCALTFGILTLWVRPYHEAARAVFYQEIVRERNVMSSGVSGGTGSADNVNTDDVFSGSTGGSVFGSGYEPDVPSANEEAPSKTDNGDTQPPLNADDL